jgi:O-succinylbenzoic acid--CoA ligase
MNERITFITQSAELKNKVLAFIDEWNSNTETIKVTTSGSTGIPKQTEILKSHMEISAKKTLNYFALKPGDTALLCLSTDTIAGKMMIVRSIVGKLNLIVGDVNSHPLHNVEHRTDFIALVPLQVEELLKSAIEKLQSIRTILIGGGPIHTSLSTKLRDQNIQAFHSYGMTETISHVAIRKLGRGETDSFEALDGIAFSHQNSKLCVHYPEIGLPTLSTNDLVELIDEKHFKFIGRTDFIVNSGGIKLNPETVEELLSSHIECSFFVSGIPDEQLGQRLILLIEGSIAQAPTLFELKALLPKFHNPKEIYFLPTFVRTESGKINRLETLKLISEES